MIDEFTVKFSGCETAEPPLREILAQYYGQVFERKDAIKYADKYLKKLKKYLKDQENK